MGVYIKGMEMPKSCTDCRFHKSIYCTLTDICTNTARCCPLVPVPKHGRLIDADALMEKKNTHIDVLADWRYVRVSTIEDAPTVIESEGE